MDKFISFVIGNTHLKELVFKDSQSRNRHSVELIVAVFSGSNNIEVFHFNYSALKQFRSHLIPRIALNKSTSLRVLNLENNDYFKNCIPSLIDNAPNLMELNLLGLEFDHQLSLNTLSSLCSIKLNYNKFIESLLSNLTSKSSLDIVVNNIRGKKRTRAIKLTNFSDVILKGGSTTIKFINCKFEYFYETQGALKSLGVQFKRSENSITIYKR